MTSKILTIAIPTYNRSAHLDFLLGVLESELKNLEERVSVYVSDNASTDETSSVVEKYLPRIPALIYHRNTENLGSEHNFNECFNLPETPYVWIIGDDDAPLRGSVSKLVQLLEKVRPDLVYLPAIGKPSIADEYQKWEAKHCNAVELTKERFASTVNAMFMFISSIVVRKSVASPESIAKALETTRGTGLTQLSWAYEVLKQGKKFYYVKETMLLSTMGKTGGYSILNVLLVNHANIACRLLSRHPKTLNQILFRTSLNYLPWLVWYMRLDKLGTFDLQHRNSILVPEKLSRLITFRFLVIPIWTFRKFWANLFYQTARVLGRLAIFYDRLITLRGSGN